MPGYTELKPMIDTVCLLLHFLLIEKFELFQKVYFTFTKGGKCNNESFPHKESKASSIFYIKSQDHEKERSG